MKINIGTKLIGSFFIVAVISVVIALTGVFGMKKIMRDMDTITNTSWPAADAVMEMKIAFLNKSHAHSSILEGQLEEAKTLWDDADKKFTHELARLEKIGILPKNEIENITNLNLTLNSTFDGMVSSYKKYTTLYEGSEVIKDFKNMLNSAEMQRFDDVVENLSPIFSKAEDAITKEMENTVSNTYQHANNEKSFLLFLLITGFILGMSIGVFITTDIKGALYKLMNAANSVGKGDFSQKLKLERQDEVGILADTFNIMVNNLRGMIVKTQDAVNKITSSGSEILSATQQQVSGAREQSSAVSETTSAAKELSMTSEQVGESIKKVAQAAGHAMNGMKTIKDALGKTNKLISSLGEKSEKIGKITELIDDVADQTNLLAVNASIEAARAGEQGRGFSVVADEIRKLADSSAKSTKDITSLVEIIQHEISNSVMAMEQSVLSVEEEVRLAEETAERSKEIAMSASQQITGAKQIAEAMANIDETMKQIAIGAQQSQTATTQLTDLANELKGTIRGFKIA
ncbi:methyl-accepting chemotaxis sensory transducer [Candidatus Omnitrophus magneticus]|uniref:Methyl-accepting chemotaxis sensory transducer n=1 Tax=Candidatus Omnitrophus magneticus TaxID=1609969 RepID=A0A0F0CPU6_9BACT|nr:methyl-accepting chemotaxis sensory transducer [Candidatus Omnitrophus magneticus]